MQALMSALGVSGLVVVLCCVVLVVMFAPMFYLCVFRGGEPYERFKQLLQVWRAPRDREKS